VRNKRARRKSPQEGQGKKSVEPRVQILFVTPEVTPFARTGGLGDVSSALPKALAALGQDVRVVMPLYQAVRDGAFALSLLLPDLQVPLHTGFKIARVWQGELTGQTGSTTQAPRVPVYCVEQDEYFARPGLYGSATDDYPDNAERFIFFCRAVLALVARLRWSPHVLHCHDWQTALLPAYLRFLPGLAPTLAQTATIYTIHNLLFQGLFPTWVLPLTGLPWSLFQPDGVEFFGAVSFMKAGLYYADYLTTVSPTYAEEICTPEFGAGLDGVLRMRRSALVGILNGADYAVWNPATDPALAAHYSAADLRGKTTCKSALLRAYGFPATLHTPLLSMIARLTEQKGVDLLAAALPDLFDMNLRLVILGTGEPRYHTLLSSQARTHPDRLGLRLEFNDDLAHQIEAGSDGFLMPSRYEPCGLNQIYSLRYGTIPIVCATGGLRDTVVPCDPTTGEGTGFVFHAATAEAFLAAVQEALTVYTDQRAWRRLVQNAMAQDFSWDQSAARYLDLYRRAIAVKRGLPAG
jgi:starch synthase